MFDAPQTLLEESTTTGPETGSRLEDPVQDDLQDLGTQKPDLTTAAPTPPPTPPPPDGETPPTPPPDDDGKQVRRHQEFARTIEAAMQEEAAPRETKRQQADQLEQLYTQKLLEPGIGLTISFGPPKYSDFQAAGLVIAPNDTRKDFTFPLQLTDDIDPDQPTTSLVDELVDGGLQIASGKKVKKKTAVEGNDPLKFIVALSKQPSAVQSQVVQKMGPGFGELLARARYDRLWSNEETTTAVVTLLKWTTPDLAKAQIRRLIELNPLGFDLSVDRFEARLAWELLRTLPAEEQAKLLDGVTPQIDPGTPQEEKQKITTLVEAGRQLAAGKKVDKDVDPDANDPLQFLIKLGRQAKPLQAQVARMLGRDLGTLLEHARYGHLWSSEPAMGAVVTLLTLAPPSLARLQIYELLSSNPLGMDLAGDRFEARLARDLLLQLPEDAQKKLLGGGTAMDKDALREEKKQAHKDDRKVKKSEKKQTREDNDLSKKLNNRAEKNMSVEYRASTHFDTYVGDKHEDVDKTTKVEVEKAGGKVLTQDSDREALLTSALDPALWAVDDKGVFTNPARLTGVLTLLIQAEQGGFVADLVAEHWTANAELLRGQGFIHSDDGTARHYQQVDDNTYTTALGRTIAGVKSFFDVISAVGSMWGMFASDKGGFKISLGNIEKAFLDKYAGLHLDHTEEVKDKKGLVETLLGGAGYATTILGVLNLVPDDLLEILNQGKDAGERLQQKLNERELVEDQETGEDKVDPTNINKIVMTRDDEKGLTTIAIPKLAVAGQAAAFGTTSTKMGPAFLKGGQIQLKNRTADDGKQFVTASLDEVELTQLMLMDQQSMMLIQKISLKGMVIEAHAQDAKPQSLMARILSDVQRSVIQALRMLPAGFWVSLGIDAAGMIEEGIQISMTAMSIADGDFKQVGLKFSSLSLSGLQDSRGNHVDALSIGETSLSMEQGVGGFDTWKDSDEENKKEDTHRTKLAEVEKQLQHDVLDEDLREFLEWRRDVHQEAVEKWGKTEVQRTLDSYTQKHTKLLAKKVPTGEKAAAIRQEQLDWYAGQISLLTRRVALYDILEQKHAALTAEQKRAAELQEQIDELETSEDRDRRTLEEMRAVEPQLKPLRKELQAVSRDVMALQGELLLLEGGHVEGNLGAVHIEGVSWEGTKIGAVDMTTTTFGQDTQTEGGSLSAHTDKIEISDLSMADFERRDQAIASELALLTESLVKLEARQQNLLAQMIGEEADNPAKITLQRSMTQEHADLLKKQAQLQTELKDLAPLLTEYELLRARLTSQDNPLTEAERQRYLQIRTSLAQPPSVTVGKISLVGVTLDVGLQNADGAVRDGTGVEASLKVDKAEVTDIGMHSVHDGSTTIQSVTATDAQFSLRQVQKEGGQDGQTEGVIGIDAEDMTIQGVLVDGKSSALSTDSKRLKAELSDIEAELARLADQPQTKDVTARREALQLRQEALRAQLATVEKEQTRPQALRELIATLEKKKGDLIDEQGNSRFRGFSLRAAVDGLMSAEKEAKKLRYGEGKGDMEVCVYNADRWAREYAAALETTRAELAALKKKEPDHNTKDLSDRSALSFWKRDMDQLQTRFQSLASLVETWTDHKINTHDALRRNQKSIDGLTSLKSAYETVFSEAKAAGLEVGDDLLKGMSAFVMQKAAQAQIDGYASTEIQKIAATDISLDIGGIQGMLNPVEETTALGDTQTSFGTVTLSGGKREGKETGDETMVGGLTIEGVSSIDENGEKKTMIESLMLGKLGGTVILKGPNDIEIKGFQIGELGMTGLQWESADYGIDCPKNILLKGMTVDAAVHTDDFGAMTGVVSSFQIDTLSTDAMKLRMGDYLFELGSLSLGETGAVKPELKGLSLSNYDLGTGVFGSDAGHGVTLNKLSTSGLQADLGGGMIVGAKSLQVGTMKVSGLMTEKEQQRIKDDRHALTEEERQDKDQAIPTEAANLYKLDMEGLSGNDVRVQMQESGIDVNISHIRGGAMKGFSYDMTTGEFGFEDVNLRSVGIGPLLYDDPSMTVKIMDMDLANVSMAAKGKMGSETERQRKEREATGKSPPESIEYMKFSSISASSADIQMLTYATRSASGDQMDVTLKHATTDRMVIRDYDFITNTMDISLTRAATEGLDVVMKDELSKTHLSGDFAIGSMDIGLLKDGSTTIDLKDTKTKGPVSVETSSTTEQWDGTKTTDNTSVKNLTANDVSGQIAMSKSIEDSKKGMETMSFKDIAIGSLGLPRMRWNALGGGDASRIDAAGVTLDTLLVTGHTQTSMVQTRVGETLVPIPQTDLYIDQLSIKEINAADMWYVSVDGRDTEKNSDRDRSVEDGMGVHLSPAKLKTVEIIDLKQIGGKITDGRIDLGEVDAKADILQDEITRRANPLLSMATNLSAKGMFVEFGAVGSTTGTRIGMKDQEKPLFARDLHLEQEDGEGNDLDLRIPEAEITGLTATLIDHDGTDTLASDISVGIKRIELLKDGSFIYTQSPRHAIEVDPDALDDQVQDEKDKGVDDTMQRRLKGINWGDFLDTINGLIGLDLSVDSDLDFEVPTEMAVFGPVLGLAVDWLWDPMGDVTVDPLSLDEAHIGIPVINGVTNRSLIQLHSGVALNLLIEVLSALVDLIPFVGKAITLLSRVADIPLDLMASSIPSFVAPKADKDKIDRLQSQAFWSQVMKGASPDLWQKYAHQITAIEDVPKVATQMRKDGHSVEAAILETVMKTFFAPQDWERATFDVFLNNIDIDLHGGPLTGKSSFPVFGTQDTTTETYDIAKLDLLFKDMGKGHYNAGVNMSDILFTSETSDQKGNSESMSAGIGALTLGGSVDNLFPDGKIYLAGSADPSTTGGPISGKLLKGSRIQNALIKIGSVYER